MIAGNVKTQPAGGARLAPLSHELISRDALLVEDSARRCVVVGRIAPGHGRRGSLEKRSPPVRPRFAAARSPALYCPTE